MLGKTLKGMIDFLIRKKKDIILSKKIKKIKKSVVLSGKLQVLDKSILKEHLKIWESYSKKINSNWIEVYSSVSGVIEPAYIPENLYYNFIEPVLNNKMFTQAYADKNFYNNFYKIEDLFPEILLRNIDGAFYNENYEHVKSIDQCISLFSAKKIVVKGTIDTGGGANVDVFVKNDNNLFYNSKNEFLSESFLIKKYKRNFNIQKYIYQDAFFKKFNESSLNTIRLFTYRSVTDEKVFILHALLRVGKPGSIVDNQASGGLSCSISSDGLLSSFAVDKFGNRFKDINGIPLTEQYIIPKFNEMLLLAEDIAKKNYYHRLLGFDFCLDTDGNIRLLEINNTNNEINFYQMNNGPLFGKFTKEVIDYCLTNPRTICLDFYY